MGSITVDTQSDWNDGDEHDGTSADRDNESGNTGIGYPSGELNVNTTMPGYDNLHAQYRFDDIDGDDDEIVSDVSGNDNDAAIHDAENTFSDTEDGLLGTGGIEASSYYSSGEAIGVQTPTPDGDITVSIWVKFSSLPGEKRLINLRDNHNVIVGPGRGDANDDQLGVWIDGTDYDNIFDLSTDTWYHIVYVYDDDNDEHWVYVNGNEELNETQSMGGDDDTDSTGVFGGGPDTARNLVGVGDEALIFDTPLSASDIQQLYFDAHNDDKFEAEYTSQIFEPENGDDVAWDDVEITADIDSGETCEVEFKALDENDQEIDSDTVTVSDGTDTYTLDLQDSPKLQFVSTHEVSVE